MQNKQYVALYPEKYRNALLAGRAQMIKFNPGYKVNFPSIQKTIRTLIDAGAHVNAGTDSPFIAYRMSLHVELQNFVDGELTPYEALRCYFMGS